MDDHGNTCLKMAEQTRLTRFLRGYAEKIPDEDVRLFAMAVVDELDEDARSDQGTIKILGDLKNRIDALETKEKAEQQAVGAMGCPGSHHHCSHR